MELSIRGKNILEEVTRVLEENEQLREENRLLKEIKSGDDLYSKYRKYCSAGGLSTAKQVEDFTGLKPTMIRELGYKGVLKEIRPENTKLVRYKFSSVLAFVNGINQEK